MEVYRVRHGEAKPEEVDPMRPLSDRGWAEVERLARALLAVERKIFAFPAASAVCLGQADRSWRLGWFLGPDAISPAP